MRALLERGLPSAGVFAGPGAWLADTQANYALVPWICATQVNLVPAIALAMALVSVFGGYLSWRAYATGVDIPPSGAATEGRSGSSVGGRPHRFMALIGMATAALFTAVILLHGAAGLMFHGCER